MAGNCDGEIEICAMLVPNNPFLGPKGPLETPLSVRLIKYIPIIRTKILHPYDPNQIFEYIFRMHFFTFQYKYQAFHRSSTP